MSKLNHNNYRLSFSGVAMLVPESIAIAKGYAMFGNWDETRKVVFDDNILQKNSQATKARYFRELSNRLKNLPDEVIMKISEMSYDEQTQFLYFAICKYYKFIHEFVVEVLFNKFRTLDLLITDADFYSFFQQKAISAPELERKTNKTIIDLKTRLYSMLIDVKILESQKNKTIQQPFLVHSVREYLENNDPDYLRIFFLET